MTLVSNEISLGRQALRRKVNTRIDSLIARNEPETIENFCECGRRLCADRVRLEIDAYEAVLDSPGQYVIMPHHDHDATQRLVTRHGDFLVVENSRH